MCLFFGNLVPECEHVECQIVQTIKNLNEQSLFRQVALQANSQHPPSIAELIDEPHAAQPKLEERDPPSLDHFCAGQPQEENQRERVMRLEREVVELRQLTLWMKAQLEAKGIL
jgi:hypothetical protein